MDSKEVSGLKKQVGSQERVIQKQKEEVEKKNKEVEKRKIEAKRASDELKLLKIERAKLKKKVKGYTDRYVGEMRRALSTAILAAFAFLMALSWREYIVEIIDSIIIFSPVRGKLVSAIVITLFSVLGILLVTKFITPRS